MGGNKDSLREKIDCRLGSKDNPRLIILSYLSTKPLVEVNFNLTQSRWKVLGLQDLIRLMSKNHKMPFRISCHTHFGIPASLPSGLVPTDSVPSVRIVRTDGDSPFPFS